MFRFKEAWWGGSRASYINDLAFVRDLALIRDLAFPQPLNETGFYLREVSIRSNTVHGNRSMNLNWDFGQLNTANFILPMDGCVVWMHCSSFFQPHWIPFIKDTCFSAELNGIFSCKTCNLFCYTVLYFVCYTSWLLFLHVTAKLLCGWLETILFFLQLIFMMMQLISCFGVSML